MFHESFNFQRFNAKLAHRVPSCCLMHVLISVSVCCRGNITDRDAGRDIFYPARESKGGADWQHCAESALEIGPRPTLPNEKV